MSEQDQSDGEGSLGQDGSGEFIELEPEQSEDGGPDDNRRSQSDNEDQEDLELLAELRQLYKGTNTSLIINTSSESINTSANDDPERLRVRVEKLQRNVNEWKESYDMLMNEFRKLKLETIVEKEKLIKEVKILSSGAKDLQQEVRRLKSELVEHQNLLKTVDATNHHLLNEVNSLRKERGMREVELSLFTDQVNALNKEGQQGRRAEEDLGHLIHLIDQGIKEGVLKLSELSVGSQSVSFPRKDVPMGPCTCGPLLERYKQDLEQARSDLAEQMEELETVRGEMATLQGEHRETLEQLAESRNMLQKTLQNQNFLEEELSKQGEHVASLELNIRSLEEQLDASRHKEQSLDDSLSSTTESLKHVQELTQQRLELKEQELRQLKSEVGTLEEKQKTLERNMEDSQLNVEQLERAYQESQEESQQLREELEEEQRSKNRELEAVGGERDKLQRKLHGMMVELECQVKLAEQYKTNLENVQQLHFKCREEAGKLRAVLLSKETELSRMLMTLQVTAGQISALQKRSRSSSPRSPRNQNQELSECETAVQEVERELRSHRKQWEALQEESVKDSATITQLTSYKDQLEEELQERRENVQHLEALLQELGMNRDRLQEVVEEQEVHVESLQQELQDTQTNYQKSFQENAELKETLASLTSLQDQQQLLIMELEKRDESILRLQSCEKEMEEQYRNYLRKAEEAASSEAVLQREYSSIQEELGKQERFVDELERRVEQERKKREEDVETLEGQLDQEKKYREQEMARCSQVIRELNDDLKSKTSHLEGALEDEHTRFMEVQQLLEEREKAIQRLQEETTFLDKQHHYTKQEVEHSQQLVESLQEDLASSKGRCDGLQQAVSEYEEKLQGMVDQLHTHQQEKKTLQDKMMLLEKEVTALQSEVEVSASQCSLLQDKQQHYQVLDQQLSSAQSRQTHLERENAHLNRTCEEQRAEMVKLRLSLSDLELQKENLDFKLSTGDKTIHSLKSQVLVLEESEHSQKKEKIGLVEKAASLSNQIWVLEEQLATVNERALQQERSRVILEMASSERLEEIRTLTRELEEMKMRTELVGELREKVEQLEEELQGKQEEVESTRNKVIEAERTHTSIYQQLSKLEQCLSEAADKDRQEEELKTLLNDREAELNQLREQCLMFEEKVLVLESEAQVSVEKENHWKAELSHISTQLELSQQKVFQLESELGRKEGELDEVSANLCKAQRFQDLAREEISSGHQLEETLQRQLAEKRTQILELERQVGTQRGELATMKGKLTTSEEGRVYLQQRVVEMEEECDRLQQSRSDTEQELKIVEQALQQRILHNQQLQEDYRSLTENMSNISKGERSSNDALVQKIREMDVQLASLKAAHNDLELRNEMLMQANTELKSQLGAVSVPSEGGPLASGSGSSFNNGGGPSSLSLSVNVDITNLPPTSSTTTVTTGTSTLGVASATVPIRFDSHYRRAMENGLLASSLEEGRLHGGSETESEAALDKDYWIRRCGEVSEQLQQSSVYWAQKVRELSIDLEKERQIPRHMD